jgi:hypothetical protein
LRSNDRGHRAQRRARPQPTFRAIAIVCVPKTCEYRAGFRSGDPAPSRITSRKAKTRARWGAHDFNGKQVRDFGYQVRQIDALFKAHALRTRLVIVDDKKSEQEIRTDLVENLKRRGDYVVVNYWREAVGQQGGGHISPLAAYDPESDSFLVLDVNPASAGWVWMPTATLVKGMRTFDRVENRGYIHT